MEDLYRLGCIGEDGEDMRHTHPRTYQVQGDHRLRIGVSGLEVMRRLLQAMPSPLWILYVHLVTRTDDEPGRYQAEEPLRRTEVEDFLQTYQSLLETDARGDLWIKSVEEPDLLVYDRHEIVFAYGDVARYRTLLEAMDYVKGDVVIPSPHTHPYRWQNDDALRELLASRSWRHTPLTESDLN